MNQSRGLIFALLAALTCCCLVSGRLRTRGIRWWNLARTSHSETMQADAPIPESLSAPFYSNPTLQILTRKQKRLVSRNPGSLEAVVRAATLAAHECSFQFRNRRWNCPLVDNSHGGSVFGKILRRGCRETAFIHSVTAAALYYSIARSCGQGTIMTCSCGTRFPDSARISAETLEGEWRWGGCSDNAEFGHNFAQHFIDSVEKGRDLRNIVNLHNAGAGRMNVMEEFAPECKCHGISGSCTTRTCWMRLRSFRNVGTRLKNKFSGASKVQQANSGYSRVKPRDIPNLMVPVNKLHKAPEPFDLVYFENSPAFCDRDTSISFGGTNGRQCNASSIGVDGCDLLCCGRGYRTEKYMARERCNCVFHWCCEVTCDVCKRTRERHVCN